MKTVALGDNSDQTILKQKFTSMFMLVLERLFLAISFIVPD